MSQSVNLAVIDGTPCTTSNQIAEHFGKQHSHVLRAIRNLDCSPEFTASNFGLSEFIDSTGRKLPCYRLTRDGFVFLAMGFTGRDAAAWKERYIAAFNAMEAQLRKVGAGDTAVPSLHNRRWLISYDHDGKELVTPVPNDACVMSIPQLLKAIDDPAMMIDTATLWAFAETTLKTLRQRGEFYQKRAKAQNRRALS